MSNKFMYRFLAVFIMCLCFTAVIGQAGNTATPKNETVFIGSTACGAFIRQLVNIPLDAASDKIQWKLTLQQDGQYFITYTYGLQQDNAPGFINGGQTQNLQGHWVLEKGTAADSSGIVYNLYMNDDKTNVLLVKMDENILHFLYKDRNLLIGNAGWGYTLNRGKN